ATTTRLRMWSHWKPSHAGCIPTCSRISIQPPHWRRSINAFSRCRCTAPTSAICRRRMTNPLQEHHRHRLRRRLGGLAALLLVVLACLLLDILLGPADLGTAQLWRALLNPGNADPVVSMIVWENRVPQ